jgi:geranylgeranyl transferase type-1 subunit beta
MTTDLHLFPFKKEHHIRYFAASLQGLPGPYAKLDTNRMTLVHFATHALDLLGVWDNDELLDTLNLNNKKIVDWIYSLQRTSKDVPPDQVGFQGGSFLGPSNTSTTTVSDEYNQGHIAMTYTALCTLTALGDDLSRVDKAGIVNGLKALQRKDGSFQCVYVKSEHDMRFLYCACAISYMLQDWSGVDTDRAVSYIESCRSFDGAISLIPEQVCMILCRILDVKCVIISWLVSDPKKAYIVCCC